MSAPSPPDKVSLPNHQKGVVSGSPVQYVVIGLAGQEIGAIPTLQRIGPASAHQTVVTGFPVQAVVPIATG